MSATASRLETMRGDITVLDVDAIVNAANPSLAPGGGVCGAIHDAAGVALAAECRALGGCPTGEARITGGYALRARHVIHAVGPVWAGGAFDEAAQLRSAYLSSLQLASDHGLRSMAFPCISTGIYGYPKREACSIAVQTVRAWLDTHALPQRVVFCCYRPDDEALYRAALAGA